MREAFDGAHEYIDRMSRLTGEYIDAYTHVPDYRTAKEKNEEFDRKWDRLMAKLPKSKPVKPLVLKPALKPAERKPLKMVNRRFVWEPSQQQEPSRARQEHQEQI